MNYDPHRARQMFDEAAARLRMWAREVLNDGEGMLHLNERLRCLADELAAEACRIYEAGIRARLDQRKAEAEPASLGPATRRST